MSPQPEPGPWGEEPGACPGWLRQGPGSSCFLWRGCGSSSPEPRASPEPCPRHSQSHRHGHSQGWGSGRKLTALSRLCTRLNTDLGAFLEYKGAWETSAAVRDQPDKRSYEPEKCADCRALKMPGYLFLLDKADKQRTKDPGLCNLGCSSLAMILRCSQGGGGRMSSSKRQLQLLSSPRAAEKRALPARALSCPRVVAAEQGASCCHPSLEPPSSLPHSVVCSSSCCLP